MVERQKQEIHPTLKAKPVEDDEQSVQLIEEMQVTILEIRDISTAHGTKTIALVQNNDGIKYNLFLNSTSLNTLIDGFGKDDETWKGKLVSLSIGNAPAPYQKTKMIIVNPVI